MSDARCGEHLSEGVHGNIERKCAGASAFLGSLALRNVAYSFLQRRWVY